MAEPLRELIAQRLRKLGELRQMGMEPFGGAFECSHTAAQLRERFGPLDGQSLEEQSPQVSVAGRLMSIRDFGKAAFSHLQDSSGRLQLYFKRDVLGEDFRLFKKYIDIGDILGARGRLFKTRTGELTVEVRGFELLCKALRPLPEKWHGLRDVEARYRQRYLDLLVNPQVKEVFLLRSRVMPTRTTAGSWTLPRSSCARWRSAPREASSSAGASRRWTSLPRGRGSPCARPC